MNQDNLYNFSLLVIALILILCICRYHNIKKEKYYNNINANINSNNINGNNNIFVPTNNQIEEKRKFGCSGEVFKKKMYNFYKNLDMYQKTYEKKQDTLHKYEELSDKLVDVKKNLIKSEEDVKTCIPNFTETN